MIIIIYIFFLIAVFCLFKWYRQTVLCYATLRLIFNGGICLRYESPNITFDFAFCLLIVFVTVIKYKSLGFKNFPFRRPLAFIILSYSIAILTSQYPLLTAGPYMFGLIVQLLFAVIFFNQLNDNKDFNIFFKCYLCVMVIFTFYGFFEFLIQKNPYIEFVTTNLGEISMGKFYTNEDVRFNSIRCQSLAMIAISYGVICSIWLIFSTQMIKKLVGKKVRIFMLSSIFLALIGCYFSGSRTPLIFVLVFYTIYVIFSKNKYLLKFFVYTLTALAFIYFSGNIMDLYYSIVDSSQSSFAGSDIVMRTMQFDAAFQALENKVIFGFGSRGVLYASQHFPALLGSESIWLQTGLEQGIFGVIAYIVIMIRVYFYSNKLHNNDRLILHAFLIAWVATSTVSSIPGLDLSYFLCMYFVLFYFLKNKPLLNV